MSELTREKIEAWRSLGAAYVEHMPNGEAMFEALCDMALASLDLKLDAAVEMERALVKQPTKIWGPNLVGILNLAGFHKKAEWVGLTAGEAAALWASTDDRDSFELLKRVEAKLKDKNSG